MKLLPVVDAFNRCQRDVVLPSGEQVIQDGGLTTGIQNYKEFFQSLSGLVGAGQNFTGNGVLHALPAGRRRQPGVAPAPAPGHRRRATATPPCAGGGTRPAKAPKAPYKPNVACHTQPVPNLNSAKTGPAWAGG